MKDKVECPIIPIPKEVTLYDGDVKLPACVHTENTLWKPLTTIFSEAVKKIFNVEVGEKKSAIELIYDSNVENEAYIIEIDDYVKVYASDYAGASYALASILQLANYSNGAFQFKKQKIFDKPDKNYRSLFVDIAREWHPFETLLKYVDVCWFYKINFFGLHFSDNEGYTLPSKAFPKLSKDGRKYTEAQIRSLCEYARARGVAIIPDIEMPGHARILTKEYPEIFSNKNDVGDTAQNIVTENGVIVTADNVMCAGSNECYNACMKLIDETIEIFGSIDYLGITCDEVNHKVYDHCSVCKEYMMKNSLADGAELYNEFVGRVTDYVLSKGITPVITEGFSKKYSHYISKDVLVGSWENHYQTTYDLLSGGYKIFNMTWKPLYILKDPNLRWGMKDILDWNVYSWQHWWPESEAFLNPVQIEETENVLGGQMCVWEQTFESEISFVLENITAFSERIWSVRRYRTYDEFLKITSGQRIKCNRLIG